jgi:hypothetical protein
MTTRRREDVEDRERLICDLSRHLPKGNPDSPADVTTWFKELEANHFSGLNVLVSDDGTREQFRAWVKGRSPRTLQRAVQRALHPKSSTERASQQLESPPAQTEGWLPPPIGGSTSKTTKSLIPLVWLVGDRQEVEMKPWPEEYRLKRLREELSGIPPVRNLPLGSRNLQVYLPQGGLLYNLRVTIDGVPAKWRNWFFSEEDLNSPNMPVSTMLGSLNLEWSPPTSGVGSKETAPIPPVRFSIEIAYDLPDKEHGTRREVLRGSLSWEGGRGWTRIELDGWGSADIY